MMYSGIKLAVFGDYMTDYWYDTDNIKLCPAFPAYDYIDKRLISDNPGGAGNTAEQMARLGATIQGFYPAIQYEAHKKKYYTYQGVIIFRDSEHPKVAEDVTMTVCSGLIKRLDEFDAVVICDYNKGLCTPDVIERIMAECADANKPVFVDPKFDNWELYEGATIFKCNMAEWLKNHQTIPYVPPYLNLVITNGADGMTVATKADQWDKYSEHIPGRNAEAVDVTGAGDIVMAVLALEYLRTDGDILKACHVANITASISVRHKRIYYPTVEEIRKEGAWDE